MPDENEALDAIIDGAKPKPPNRCTVCALGEEAVALVARIVARDDDCGSQTHGRFGVHATRDLLAARYGYKHSTNPIREHARRCMGRHSWSTP